MWHNEVFVLYYAISKRLTSEVYNVWISIRIHLWNDTNLGKPYLTKTINITCSFTVCANLIVNCLFFQLPKMLTNLASCFKSRVSIEILNEKYIVKWTHTSTKKILLESACKILTRILLSKFSNRHIEERKAYCVYPV